MRISQIDIHNILGTREASFKPGTLTVISGQNASGKTSIIRGLLSVFEGGHDPGILRRGAKSGQILITLDNGCTIRKKVTEKSSTLEVCDRDGNVIPSPKKFVDDLGESLAVDPARLLTAKPKDLVPVLLEVMPVTFKASEIGNAVGSNVANKYYPGNSDMDLEGLDAYRKSLYEARTTANGVMRDIESTLRELKKAIPEDDGKDWSAEVNRLIERGHEIERAVTVEAEAIEADLRAEVEALNEEYKRKREEAQARAKEKRAALDSAAQPERDANTTELAVARERFAAQNRTSALKGQIATTDSKRLEYGGWGDKLTYAIEALDNLKKQKLESTPIPGLEVRGDKVLYGDIPFEHVNLAKRVEIAFQISALRAGWLPFMVIDNAEMMDPETWQAFCAGAVDSGFQVIAARVGPGELEIEVESSQPALV